MVPMHHRRSGHLIAGAPVAGCAQPWMPPSADALAVPRLTAKERPDAGFARTAHGGWSTANTARPGAHAGFTFYHRIARRHSERSP